MSSSQSNSDLDPSTSTTNTTTLAPSSAMNRGRPWSRDWSKVDWSLKNIEIAKQLGCSPQAVCYARHRHYDHIPNRYFGIDWTKVDWSLKNSEIAKQLGCSPCAVGVARRRRFSLGMAAHRRHCKYDWSKVDWSLKNAEIARQLGCLPKAVSHARRRLGIPTIHKSPRRYDWSKVDWSLQNTAIAKQLGCSRWAVSLMRRRKKIPPSLLHGAHIVRRSPSPEILSRVRKAEEECLHLTLHAAAKKVGLAPGTLRAHTTVQFVKLERQDWTKVDWSRRTRDLAKEFGCFSEAISGLRRRYAPETLNRFRGPGRQFDWSSVDWSMRNVDIAKKFGTSYAYVSLVRKRLAPQTARKIRRGDDGRTRSSPPSLIDWD